MAISNVNFIFDSTSSKSISSIHSIFISPSAHHNLIGLIKFAALTRLAFGDGWQPRDLIGVLNRCGKNLRELFLGAHKRVGWHESLTDDPVFADDGLWINFVEHFCPDLIALGVPHTFLSYCERFYSSSSLEKLVLWVDGQGVTGISLSIVEEIR